MGATRPHNPAARGELLGATAPWQNRSQTKKNKPALNTKLRRKFNDALKLDPQDREAAAVLLLMGKLYAVEKEAREAGSHPRAASGAAPAKKRCPL